MKFTKIPETAFDEIQLNAGILLKTFAPETATFEPTGILGATSAASTSRPSQLSRTSARTSTTAPRT